MKTAKDKAMYILASVGEDKNSIEVIEREIIDYAKQKVKERDEQWKSFFHPNKNFCYLLKQLKEPKFE